VQALVEQAGPELQLEREPAGVPAAQSAPIGQTGWNVRLRASPNAKPQWSVQLSQLLAQWSLKARACRAAGERAGPGNVSVQADAAR
jgi:hypothetical protein